MNRSRHIVVKKNKCTHCLFCCSVAGREYRHWCWCLQQTTELFACLALSDVKHCYLTAGRTELQLSDERPPLRYLLSPGRGSRPMIMTPFVTSLRYRSRIWTACRSVVLPVGGLQRPCRNHVFSSFWALAGSGKTRRLEKTVFYDMGHLSSWGYWGSWTKTCWEPLPDVCIWHAQPCTGCETQYQHYISKFL